LENLHIYHLDEEDWAPLSQRGVPGTLKLLLYCANDDMTRMRTWITHSLPGRLDEPTKKWDADEKKDKYNTAAWIERRGKSHPISRSGEPRRRKEWGQKRKRKQAKRDMRKRQTCHFLLFIFILEKQRTKWKFG
jgi:hypothetical protein